MLCNIYRKDVVKKEVDQMRLISQPKIILTDEEKKTLYEAAEIIKGITDMLLNNTGQGFQHFRKD